MNGPLTIRSGDRLVLETLTPLPSDRKCFRMINGVLVERTVGDVLPTLQSNSDNMNKALEQLAKQYRSKQDEMEKWKVCNKMKRATFVPVALTDMCYRRRTRSRSYSSEREIPPATSTGSAWCCLALMGHGARTISLRRYACLGAAKATAEATVASQT